MTYNEFCRVMGAKIWSVKVFLAMISLLRDSEVVVPRYKDYQTDMALLLCSDCSVLLLLTKPGRKAEKNWPCLKGKTKEVR